MAAMTPQEKFRKLLEGFLDLHEMRIGRDGLTQWMQAVRVLTLDQLEFGIDRFNRECRERPRPSLLLQYAGHMTDEARAENAWTVVRKAIASYGYSQSVDFDDRLINAAIRKMGSWHNLCLEVEGDNRTWAGREFMKLYRLVAQTGAGDGSPLLGLPDVESYRDGFPLSAPTLVVTGMPVHPVASALPQVDRKRVNGVSPEVRRLADQMGREINDGE